MTRMVRYGLWAGLLVAPLAINLLIWKGLVVPQQRANTAWDEVRAVTEVKPGLEALVAQHQQILLEWNRTALTGEPDPTAAMQRLQQLAERHRVQVKELAVAGEGRAPTGGDTVPLQMQVTGRFGQLARWLNEVEAQSGVQVESWAFSNAQPMDQAHQLAVKLTALFSKERAG